MKLVRLALSDYPFVDLSVIGFLIFFLIFCGMLFWIFRKGSKKFYNDMSNLPLED
ncbi:MAG: cbb3-type cytochrome c oxidase subunit 3 [Bdellovibrionota bacterium]|nr:CcoQ/FixQ family Cbb3-type cytochrome c oxidase assembly chaperone [Pseudobdellovibrionaceae bacterium]MEC9281569.1 cbb3-type cytochrome c oxidase subunit 3 [Bdellovibrionota bacterium]